LYLYDLLGHYHKIFLILVLTRVLYQYNIIPHLKYSNEDFKIIQYVSVHDKDMDGVDDQTDILQNVRAYIATRPKYQSKYYATGYPNDEYGVCTDVVAQGLLHAGYDIMELLHQDVLENPGVYKLIGITDESVWDKVKQAMKEIVQGGETA